MRVKPTAEVLEFLRPVAEEQGVDLVDCEWDMRTRSLTLFLDAEGGIDLNRLEAFHRAVDGPLDELDPTYGEPYTLNCSSLGLDRPFKTERDFLKHLGEKVEVRLYAPLDGKKYYEGELKSYEGETFTVLTEQGEKTFSVKAASKVCLYIEV